MLSLEKNTNKIDLEKYYDEILNEYEKLNKIVIAIEEAIISNKKYFIELSQSFIDTTFAKNKNIFKAYDIINEEHFKYIDYLISEFYISELYIYYMFLKNELEKVEEHIFKLYENEEMPESLSLKIYKKYSTKTDK